MAWRRQAITWAKVDTDLCRCVTSFDRNVLNVYMFITISFTEETDMQRIKSLIRLNAELITRREAHITDQLMTNLESIFLEWLKYK